MRHALVPVVAYFLGRSLGLTWTDLGRLGWTLLAAAGALAAGGLIDLYAVDVECGAARAPSATSTASSASTTTARAACPTTGRSTPQTGCTAGSCRASSARSRPRSCFLVALLLSGVALQSRRRRPIAVGLIALCSVGLLFTLSRSSLVSFAGGLVVLAVAARRWWPVAAAALVLVAGVAYAYSFTSVAPKTHFFPADLPYQREQARQHGGLPGGGSLALNPGEPSLRSHWRNLRDGIDTVLHHPQGYGLGNAGATASRFGVPLRAGESNYTETGVETGLLGALLFIAWSLALLYALMRSAWAPDDGTTRWAAAGGAAALAAILALAIQTDAYGVPWLAYCLWWLAGSLVEPAAVPFAERSRSSTPAYASATST